MKNIINFLTIIILLTSCKKEEKISSIFKDSTNGEIDTSKVKIDSSKIKVSNNESTYVEPKDGYYSKLYKNDNIIAKVFYKRKNERIDYYKIKIYKDNNLKQTIFIKSDAEFLDEDYINLTFEDANFDGKKDILINKFIGMNWEERYLFLNYNDKYKMYPKFDTLIGPYIDEKNKQIIASFRIGPSPDFNTDTYKWKNGKLKFIKNEIITEQH